MRSKQPRAQTSNKLHYDQIRVQESLKIEHKSCSTSEQSNKATKHEIENKEELETQIRGNC